MKPLNEQPRQIGLNPSIELAAQASRGLPLMSNVGRRIAVKPMTP